MKHHLFFPLLFAALFAADMATSAFAQKEGNEMEAIGKGSKADEILQKDCPPGSTHEFMMVPMRDGVKLATDVFIPPGNGPWPVEFARGYYGRLNSVDGKSLPQGKIVFICQDARGTYDSEGKGAVNMSTPDSEINDTSDSLDWIAAQKWCDGTIGLSGASGNGVGPFCGFLSKNPHLKVVNASISCPWPYYYWGFHNGVRRYLYEWLSHDSLKVTEWPKPTLPSYDVARLQAVLKNAADKNQSPLILSCGWYDISPEATIDLFTACGSSCRIFATISPGGHGGHCPFTWPTNSSAKPPPYLPTFFDVLTGKAKLPDKSELTYFVMGNFRDPKSPGNYYKTTDTWPVPNTPTPYYLHADGSLSMAKPAEVDTVLAYTYDPKDPAPSIGIKESLNSGPFDQRPLEDRKDVLHFTSQLLEAPLEFTGKIVADLFVSTDVPDTEFVVKLIDIQPDGYEMLIRESPILGRYAEELQGKPGPLEKGKVYHLKIDLRTTSIILDKGHRLGLLVTSSSKPEYEVHPNTFESVSSYDNSPAAHQQIHLSSQFPSSVTLPVITNEKP